MTIDDKCFAIDSFDFTILDFVQDFLSKDLLELCLTKGEKADEAVEVHV